MKRDIRKIFILTEILFPNEGGGLSFAVYWQLLGMSRTEFKGDIRVLTTNQGISSDKVTTDRWLDAEWGKVKYRTFFIYKLPICLMFESIREIYKADVVHLISVFYPPVIFAFFWAKIFGKKIIWSPHGSIDDKELIKNAKIKKYYLRVMRYFVKDVMFHTTCDAESVFTRKQFGNKLKITQITNYMVLPERINVEKEKYLLFIGRFNIKKGVDNLLKGLSVSKAFLRSDFVLMVVGDYDNPYGEYILGLCKELGLEDKVLFLGHKGGVEKQEILGRAYFLFMPSYTENFGIVVTEALAQATPAVASIYTPWEVLEQFKAGFWVDNRPNVLAEIVDQIINMPPEEYIEYCTNASKLVKEQFDIFSNVDKWRNIYI